MPRRIRLCPAGIPQHIVQRGNNRQACFTSDNDIKAYAHWLYEASSMFGVQVHAWVFMTNHVHLLMTPTQEQAISRCMQYIGRYYARYFNYRCKRTGTLFEDRIKSHPVQTSMYYLIGSRYIELNPVRAGMVSDPADYQWSSYAAHALGKEIRMWTPHVEFERLGSTQRVRQISYRQLFETELDSKLISEIKCAQETVFVLGTEKFRRQFEVLTGQPQSLQKRGPKPKREL